MGRPEPVVYRGRLAPSPTGYLHVGHGRTFWIAHQRARERGGQLVLRNEDLDRRRCPPHFVSAMLEDLRWLGLAWQEGPDLGGPFGPYTQSERLTLYRAAFERLRVEGQIYPCACSRQDVLRALQAPHAGDDEPIYPGTCRPPAVADGNTATTARTPETTGRDAYRTVACNWRFRVPDGEPVEFVDGGQGAQRFVAGRDFGDFVVWRQDDLPAYQLACVVDDAAMRMTEVVRGADLLRSTARQLLLYRALGLSAPAFFHCPLVVDEQGVRLAKRHAALSLRTLRAQGVAPGTLGGEWRGVRPAPTPA